VILFTILDVSYFLILVPTGERQYFMTADNDIVQSCMVKLSSVGTCINLIILFLVLKNEQLKCMEIIIITVNECKLSCIYKSDYFIIFYISIYKGKVKVVCVLN
jgi:hypothetical protein